MEQGEGTAVKSETTFAATFRRGQKFLLEGALGERLKREFGLTPHPEVALAGFVQREEGRKALRTLWLEYAGIAHRHGLPFLATTPTRRANRDRVERAGLDETLLLQSVSLLREVQSETPGEMYAGGMVGCFGDAYTGEGALSETEAYDFHRWQTELFRKAGVDFLYGALLPTLPEAAGLAKAMGETGLPYLLSFTIQRNGTLIDGTPISDAITAIDNRDYPKPLCYMTNCVHPSIVYEALSAPCNQKPNVRERFLGIQGNTSPLSYAQLDRAADLLTTGPEPFARDTLRLLERSPMQIFGGCCGTDGRHLECIAALLSL